MTKGKTDVIQYKRSLINIYFFGSGDKILFCFHGFGEDAKSFEILEETLGTQFTLISIDLPFHGSTKWNEGFLITPEDLLCIMEAIIQNNNLSSKFSLIAFSLGGRVALHLLQTVPSKIEQVVLIAPDGLHLNFWYWAGTQTVLGNKLFAYTMKKPKWFFAMVNAGYKIGLLNKSIVKFVHYYLDDDDARALLYQRWTTMRKFKPKSSQVINAIDNYGIQVRILFGKYDRIILSERSNFFKKNENVKITIIDAGHQLLKEKFANIIASLFSQ